ncbi:MAG TPA: tetratricopeptide repeat protein [Candidatus Hydrogenedentes bacterium]|nr:tetratricopeptide repeat protein [Candidatus Hydrogenedentota bacterium]HOL77552.1 tetratricopeptide repeat protein [Candidatus Hydrogenedentota bacterium]HPO84857.1 tetratricopeptide repeat protein [Candidatus Hydrogenedentota bacterium]
MKHHRLIWYVAFISSLCAIGVITIRKTVEAPSSSNVDELVRSFLAAVDKDPQLRHVETKGLVNRLATLAKTGDTRSAEAFYALGLQLRLEGRLSEAADAFGKCVQLKPDWARGYNGLGGVLYRLGKVKEAEEALRRATILDPMSSRAHNDLAVMLRLENRLQEALPEAERAVELAPEDVAAQNNYGNLLLALGRCEEAAACYRKASVLDPNHPAPFYNLACLASMMGKEEEAFNYLRRAITLDPLFESEALHDPHLEPLRKRPDFSERLRALTQQSLQPNDNLKDSH